MLLCQKCLLPALTLHNEFYSFEGRIWKISVMFILIGVVLFYPKPIIRNEMDSDCISTQKIGS